MASADSSQASDWYEVNAMQLSKFCLARGRYELAEKFHIVGTRWYEQHVVNKRFPGDTAADRRRFREYLADYKAFLPEFPRLVKTRAVVLQFLSTRLSGIDRKELQRAVCHDGVTKFGVICNQLARGGWLLQRKEGKVQVVSPAAARPASDEVFTRSELPRPAG